MLHIESLTISYKGTASVLYLFSFDSLPCLLLIVNLILCVFLSHERQSVVRFQ